MVRFYDSGEVKRAIQTFEEWLPKIVYGLAMLYAISGIISSFQAAMRGQEKLINLGE